MKPTCIFIVEGNYLKEDLSNMKVISTKVVPNIGERIVFRGETRKVVDKVINYSQVESYDLKDLDRGKEMIYIFI